LSWGWTAREITDRLRAYTPWPGLAAELRDEPVKLVRAMELQADAAAAAPGTVLGLRDGALAVACGGGTVLGIQELQRPGRKALRAADFANGERLRPGEAFS
jgi:methionyl-tRNA formyltransferase